MDNAGSDQRNRSARHVEAAAAVIDEGLAAAIDHADGVFLVEVPVETLPAKIGAQEQGLRQVPVAPCLDDIFGHSCPHRVVRASPRLDQAIWNGDSIHDFQWLV